MLANQGILYICNFVLPSLHTYESVMGSAGADLVAQLLNNDAERNLLVAHSRAAFGGMIPPSIRAAITDF
jgi:hypothetical protein